MGEKVETKIISNHHIKAPFPTKIKGAAVLDKKTGPATPAVGLKKTGKSPNEPKSPEAKAEEVK